jgi:hypothetical protein
VPLDGAQKEIACAPHIRIDLRGVSRPINAIRARATPRAWAARDAPFVRSPSRRPTAFTPTHLHAGINYWNWAPCFWGMTRIISRWTTRQSIGNSNEFLLGSRCVTTCASGGRKAARRVYSTWVLQFGFEFSSWVFYCKAVALDSRSIQSDVIILLDGKTNITFYRCLWSVFNELRKSSAECREYLWTCECKAEHLTTFCI